MQPLDRRSADGALVRDAPLHPATRALFETWIRLGKGLLSAAERWLQSHP